MILGGWAGRAGRGTVTTAWTELDWEIAALIHKMGVWGSVYLGSGLVTWSML